MIVNNLKAIFFQNPEEKLNGADFIVASKPSSTIFDVLKGMPT